MICRFRENAAMTPAQETTYARLIMASALETAAAMRRRHPDWGGRGEDGPAGGTKTAKVMDALGDAPRSLFEIADATGLAVNEVRGFVPYLQRLGLVQEQGRARGPTGRTIRLYVRVKSGASAERSA